MLMPNPETSGTLQTNRPDQEGVADQSVSVEALLAIVRRQSRVLILCVLVGLSFGAAYLATAQKKYTASVNILIDSKKAKGLGATDGTLADLQIDTSAVDSQVELLKSRQILEAAARALQVEADGSSFPLSDVVKQVQSSIQAIVSKIVPIDEVPLTEEEMRLREQERLIGFFSENLDIKRVGRTYVLAIAFTSTSPSKSAAIANGIAQAYLEDQFNANFEISRRASEWLQNRIQDVKAKSQAADLAVQRFAAEKGLIATSKDGALISEQQLTEVNSQLIAARAETSRIRAKYENIAAIIKAGRVDATVSESINNPVIVALRNKFLATSKTESELSQKLGRDHAQVVRLRAEMGQYETQILDELGRIAEGTKSEYNVALAREKALEEALAGQVDATGKNSVDLVHLRELERESETYRSLLQNLLMRYQEALQRQSFPVSEARVISEAIRPIDPSSPKKVIVLALAAVGGILLGALWGAWREYRDRGFRTSAQLREALGLEFLGMVPAVTQRQLNKIPPMPRGRSGDLTSSALMRYATEMPLSGFSETLRTTKVSIDIFLGDVSPKIIGITSILPYEGKTTVSKNLASLVAHLGARVILIDGDMRNPGLTREVCSNAGGGLLEVLMEGKPWQDYLLHEPNSGLTILPAPIDRRVSHTSELLSSPAMKRLLVELGAHYDYIFVDLPPLGPAVDARAASRLFNCFVFVVEWGKTPRAVVRDTLMRDLDIYKKCVGIVMNKVDFKMLRLFESQGSKEYYYGQYTSYYRDGV